jgi:DNA modification methylase
VTPFVQDADFTLYVGDVREVLAGLPDESVHCVVTSPPYWGLRDYGTGSWAGGDEDHTTIKGRRSDKSGLAGYTSENVKVRTNSVPFKAICGKCGAQRVDQQLGLEPTPELYVANMVAVFREVRRVLRRDGTCWLNIGDSYALDAMVDGGRQEGPKRRSAT